jgi:hypothetical protein
MPNPRFGWWANGERYERDFKDGKRDGYGTAYLRKGAVKKGRWSNNDYVGP